MSETPQERLRAISRTLRELHAQVLDVDRTFHPPFLPLELLERLTKDPEWAWLRPLSALVADIDHVLAQSQAATEYDLAIVAAHARELLNDEQIHAPFIDRYRALLQLNPALVIVHGELKSLLDAAPSESANEAERLHHRHQWAMRLKHRLHG